MRDHSDCLMDNNNQEAIQYLRQEIKNLSAQVSIMRKALYVKGGSAYSQLPPMKILDRHCYGGVLDVKELEIFVFNRD